MIMTKQASRKIRRGTSKNRNKTKPSEENTGETKKRITASTRHGSVPGMSRQAENNRETKKRLSESTWHGSFHELNTEDINEVWNSDSDSNEDESSDETSTAEASFEHFPSPQTQRDDDDDDDDDDDENDDDGDLLEHLSKSLNLSYSFTPKEPATEKRCITHHELTTKPRRKSTAGTTTASKANTRTKVHQSSTLVAKRPTVAQSCIKPQKRSPKINAKSLSNHTATTDDLSSSDDYSSNERLKPTTTTLKPTKQTSRTKLKRSQSLDLESSSDSDHKHTTISNRPRKSSSGRPKIRRIKRSTPTTSTTHRPKERHATRSSSRTKPRRNSMAEGKDEMAVTSKKNRTTKSSSSASKARRHSLLDRQEESKQLNKPTRTTEEPPRASTTPSATSQKLSARETMASAAVVTPEKTAKRLSSKEPKRIKRIKMKKKTNKTSPKSHIKNKLATVGENNILNGSDDQCVGRGDERNENVKETKRMTKEADDASATPEESTGESSSTASDSTPPQHCQNTTSGNHIDDFDNGDGDDGDDDDDTDDNTQNDGTRSVLSEAGTEFLDTLRSMGIAPVLKIPDKGNANGGVDDDDDMTAMTGADSLWNDDVTYVQDLINQKHNREDDRNEEALEEALELYQTALQSGYDESEELFLQLFMKVSDELGQKYEDHYKAQDKRLEEALQGMKERMAQRKQR